MKLIVSTIVMLSMMNLAYTEAPLPAHKASAIKMAKKKVKNVTVTKQRRRGPSGPAF